MDSKRHRSTGITLAVVVPCYNEGETLPTTAERVSAFLADLVSQGVLTDQSRVYFVDDGSTDTTWTLIEQLTTHNPAIAGIKLSRNVGHQNALMAGISCASGDAVVTIDADLQDDITVLKEMLREFASGRDIVYGVRKRRTTDTLFKRLTAHAFYCLMLKVGAEVVADHGDFRLLSRRAVEWLREFGEVEVFLRGVVPRLSINASRVYYERSSRLYGRSKYSIGKMLALAWHGLTSLTVLPLRLVTMTGFIVFAISMALALWAVWIKLSGSGVVPGWASIVVPMCFIGGVQILCVGLLGEYIAKLFIETKHRPRFFIEKRIN